MPARAALLPRGLTEKVCGCAEVDAFMDRNWAMLQHLLPEEIVHMDPSGAHLGSWVGAFQEFQGSVVINDVVLRLRFQ